jgi:LPS O-antigen subunit length determinant protein (WzzB/FepE family)
MAWTVRREVLMDGLHSREEIAGSRGAISRAGAVNVEITEILRTLWRHRSLIGLVTIAFAVAAWVFVSRIQPV